MLFETTGAVLFLTAASLALLTLVKGAHQKLFLAIFAVGLLCFLEEVSYGKQLFGIDHIALGRLELDGTLYLFKRSLLYLFDYPQWSLPILGALGIFTVYLWGPRAPLSFAQVPSLEAYILACLFILLTGASVLIDAHVFRSAFLNMLEETLEMDAALALLLSCLALRRVAKFAGHAVPASSENIGDAS
jgi:hypothetical protein